MSEAILNLPKLGETMEEGRVTAWLVQPGQAFKRGEALVEIDTDKTAVEVPALADGVLAEILAAEGTTVAVGAPLARLEGSAERGAPTESKPDTPEPEIDLLAEDRSSDETPVSTPPSTDPKDPVRATPLARRLARNAMLDISQIRGSGRRGRVERRDVEAALAATVSGGNPDLRHAHGLAHVVTGPETGAPILLLHGFGADHSVWSGLASSLARADRRVLAVDLPGHGATRAEAAKAADLSAGLADLVRDVFGAARPAVVAHSLGAVPAVALAKAGGVRSLTLIAPVGLGLNIDRTFVHGLAASPTPGELSHLLDRMTEGDPPLSDTAKAEIVEALANGRLRKLAGDVVGQTGQALSIRGDLARLAVDMAVRILAPHRDRIVDWQDAFSVSPRISVHHLTAAGHVAHWDAPRDVLNVVLAATEQTAGR